MPFSLQSRALSGLPHCAAALTRFYTPSVIILTINSLLRASNHTLAFSE